MANNNKQWSSADPGMIVVLVDQSGSMMADYQGQGSRTQFAATVINRVINEIINKNFAGVEPKNRCFISVVGYDSAAHELASGWLAELDKSPKRIDKVQKMVPNGAGGLVSTEVDMPIWVDPITDDNWTDMRAGFMVAKELVSEWIQSKPSNPAPVIINISDGVPYWGPEPEECMKETVKIVDEIKALSNEDGNVLVFNAMIGDGSESVFPNSRSSLSNAQAQFLFDISSEVPEGYKSAAQKNGLPITDGTRGCIFNAKPEDLIRLIDFGSSKGIGDR